ncbi:hypothetical protein ACFQ1S_14305, partial [Kibdelosporangium lantanae]
SAFVLLVIGYRMLTAPSAPTIDQSTAIQGSGGRTAVAPQQQPGGGILPPPPPLASSSGEIPGIGHNSQTGTDTRTTTNNDDGVDITLNYRADWSVFERVDAEAKVQFLNFRARLGTLYVEAPGARSNDQRRVWIREYGLTPPEGFDVDHMLDHQFGGPNTIDNMSLLLRSPNRSIGKQLELRTRHLPVGTRIRSVRIVDPAITDP